jgi:hypothetical protein
VHHPFEKKLINPISVNSEDQVSGKNIKQVSVQTILQENKNILNKESMSSKG